jgi:hypothetical protein
VALVEASSAGTIEGAASMTIVLFEVEVTPFWSVATSPVGPMMARKTADMVESLI